MWHQVTSSSLMGLEGVLESRRVTRRCTPVGGKEGGLGESGRQYYPEAEGSHFIINTPWAQAGMNVVAENKTFLSGPSDKRNEDSQAGWKMKASSTKRGTKGNQTTGCWTKAVKPREGRQASKVGCELLNTSLPHPCPKPTVPLDVATAGPPAYLSLQTPDSVCFLPHSDPMSQSSSSHVVQLRGPSRS